MQVYLPHKIFPLMQLFFPQEWQGKRDKGLPIKCIWLSFPVNPSPHREGVKLSLNL